MAKGKNYSNHPLSPKDAERVMKWGERNSRIDAKIRSTSDGHMVFRDLTPGEQGEMSPKMYKQYKKERQGKNASNRHSYHKRQFERGEDKQALE